MLINTYDRKGKKSNRDKIAEIRYDIQNNRLCYLFRVTCRNAADRIFAVHILPSPPSCQSDVAVYALHICEYVELFSSSSS